MNLVQYARWRQWCADHPREPLADSGEVLALLGQAALVALRAGVRPTLEDLMASPEVEAAWLSAAAIFREEQAFAAKGLTPERAVELAHDSAHEAVFGGGA